MGIQFLQGKYRKDEERKREKGERRGTRKKRNRIKVQIESGEGGKRGARINEMNKRLVGRKGIARCSSKGGAILRWRRQGRKYEKKKKDKSKEKII